MMIISIDCLLLHTLIPRNWDFFFIILWKSHTITTLVTSYMDYFYDIIILLQCHFVWKFGRTVSKQCHHFEWALINMYYTASKTININSDRCSMFILIGIFLKSFKYEEVHSDGQWEKMPHLLFCLACGDMRESWT